MTTVALGVRVEDAVWQVWCELCGASYAVVHKDVSDAHPAFCVFCARRASIRRVPVERAATF